MAEWKLPADHPWNVDGPANRWRHAFKPASYSVVVEKRGANWEEWDFDMPIRDNGEPGDGKKHFDGFWSLLNALAVGLMSAADTEHGKHRRRFERVRPIKHGFFHALRTLFMLPVRAVQFLIALLGWMRTILKLLDSGDALRKIAILLDLGLATIWGLLCNWWKISRHSLDALDDMEMRDFLRRYGARESSVNSPVIGSIYDAVFAQVGGDPAKENFAAGAGLRSMLRILLGYKHSMFFKMQAGMGDTVFTPLYEVLKARGVKFRYFHQVRAIELSEDKKSVARVRIGRQVTLRDGRTEYDPLVTVKGLGCWPSEAQWDQIEEAAQIQAGGYNLENPQSGWADREELVLRKREGEEEEGELVFDRVVLGISIGAFRFICPELIAANAKFKAMVDHVLTVRTEAIQLWMKPDLAGLGWKGAPAVFGNFIDPMNTWADMSHLLPREDLKPTEDIHSVAYLCGPMPDSVPPDDVSASAHVRQSAEAVTAELARSFWTDTATPVGGFNPALVAMEYLRWNVTPSERYVLTVAGSTKHRLAPGDSGFKNLTLAGDWTSNGWNAGCVEATVMSGMLASHAISGYPKRKDIAYVDGP